MELWRALPAVSPAMRGGTVQIGYDRVRQIREEARVLEDLAALIIGRPAESLSIADVQAFVADVLNARQARIDASEVGSPAAAHRADVLAWMLVAGEQS